MVSKQYSFLQSVIYGFSGGIGFSLVLIIMAGIREELEFADIPKVFRGAALTLVTAGMLALIFTGFSGLVK